MATKVGPYLWEIDIKDMELEELEALRLIVSDTIKQRRLEQCYEKKLHDLIDEAQSKGVYFNYSSSSMWVSLTEAQEKIYASPIGG